MSRRSNYGELICRAVTVKDDGFQQRFGSCERDSAGCTEVTRGTKEGCALRQVDSVNARKMMRAICEIKQSTR